MGVDRLRHRLPVVGALPEPTRDRRVETPLWGPSPRPSLCVWELTLACDQECLHCGPRAHVARNDELDTEECLQVVSELAELGVGEVTLIGGEAYLRDDFILIVRAIRNHGMQSTLTTGGYNLTEARARAMVDAGVQSVSVSIDGLSPCHDRLRGRPESWTRAFAALSRVRVAGAQISANTQINAWTLHDLEPLLEHLAAAGIHAWQLQITVAHGRAGDHPEILLQPFAYPELFDILDRLADRCRELGVTLTPANSLGYFGPYEFKLRHLQQGTGHYRGCTSGVTTIALESNGMVKGCPSLGGRNNLAGSWREHGLRALWDRSPELTYMRHRTQGELWGYCATCHYAQICKGGCTSVSEPLLGRPGNNPMCHHRSLELARQGLRERVEWVRSASGEAFDNGLFRIVREYIDAELRARYGPVTIDEPRTARADDPFGPGSPV